MTSLYIAIKLASQQALVRRHKLSTIPAVAGALFAVSVMYDHRATDDVPYLHRIALQAEVGATFGVRVDCAQVAIFLATTDSNI